MDDSFRSQQLEPFADSPFDGEQSGQQQEKPAGVPNRDGFALHVEDSFAIRNGRREAGQLVDVEIPSAGGLGQFHEQWLVEPGPKRFDAGQGNGKRRFDPWRSRGLIGQIHREEMAPRLAGGNGCLELPRLVGDLLECYGNRVAAGDVQCGRHFGLVEGG